eukprot:1022652-Pelagomonas_calceolata.AAC.1
MTRHALPDDLIVVPLVRVQVFVVRPEACSSGTNERPALATLPLGREHPAHAQESEWGKVSSGLLSQG